MTGGRLLAFALLCEVGELVGAQQELFALACIGMAGSIGLVDGILDSAVQCGLQESALFLDAEEQLPCLLGQCCGQHLEEVGTASHIDHAVEVTLVLQQQLLVAGNALGKLGGSLVRQVEGTNHDALHTSQCGTHRLGLRTKHVHVAVKESLVESRRVGAYMHLGAFLVGSVLADNLCPKHACCTQLGNLHEVDTVDAKVELDVLCGYLGSDTSLGQLLHVFVTPSQRIA